MELHRVDKALPVFTVNIGDLFDLNTRIPEYRKQNPESSSSNVNAWHSPYMTAGFDDVKQHLTSIAEEAVCKFYDNIVVNLDCKELWVMEYESNDFADLHCHYPATWSGVYYLNCGKDPAPLVIERQLTVKPKEGLFILFPSVMMHFVPPTKSFRRALAVNFFVKCDVENLGESTR